MGCVRNLTKNDYEQLAKCVERCRVDTGKLGKEQRDKIRKTLRSTSRSKLLDALKNPGSRAYDAVAQLLCGAMVSTMTPAEQTLLPKAFESILTHTPDAMGLFMKAPAHRGSGSSAVQHHYEIMATAAILDYPHDYKTRSGKQLYLDVVDRVDFGIRYSRDYASPRRFGTFEADMLIHRGTLNPFSGDMGKNLAIDAKHSQSGNYSLKPELHQQLAGIRTALRDGKIDEFCFVTNRGFTDGFKEAIDKANLFVAKDFLDANSRIYREEPLENLTRAEREHQRFETSPPGFFSENNEEFQCFVREHDIPQIDLAEYVEYPGT